MSLRYLTAKQAYNLDQLLVSKYNTSISTAMEKAGETCAVAFDLHFHKPLNSKILICCGPGNNGGDGLVAAKYLHKMGYKNINVWYPKHGKSETLTEKYQGIIKNFQQIKFIQTDEFPKIHQKNQPDLLIDAIFGFSFVGAPRPPFDLALNYFEQRSLEKSNNGIFSLDVPSGWKIDKIDNSDDSYWVPEGLISLTAPKLCSQQIDKNSDTKHYLAGSTFIPEDLLKEFEIWENFKRFGKNEMVIQVS